MKPTLILICNLFLSICANCFAQGFINLNFEKAKIITSQGSRQYATNAIPGWTSYISGVARADLFYNDISLGAADTSIHDTNSVYPPPIQGKYMILLQGAQSAFPLGPQTAGIGQTAQISASAMSVSFWGYFGGSLTFNNQALNYLQTGSTANYNIYTADVSPFSGQVGELLFTTPFQSSGGIDNIQFSTAAVPEPSTLALTALGVLLLGWRSSWNCSRRRCLVDYFRMRLRKRMRQGWTPVLPNYFSR